MSQGQTLQSLAPEASQPLPKESLELKVDKCKKDPCPKKDECAKKDPCAKEDPCAKKDPCAKEDPCAKKDPCAKDPCAKDPCAPKASYGWGWLGALILWFIIFTVLFWLIYYSLKPTFVLQNDSNQVDTAKVLLAAVISALILVIIIWLIKAAINRR